MCDLLCLCWSDVESKLSISYAVNVFHVLACMYMDGTMHGHALIHTYLARSRITHICRGAHAFSLMKTGHLLTSEGTSTDSHSQQSSD